MHLQVDLSKVKAFASFDSTDNIFSVEGGKVGNGDAGFYVIGVVATFTNGLISKTISDSFRLEVITKPREESSLTSTELQVFDTNGDLVDLSRVVDVFEWSGLV